MAGPLCLPGHHTGHERKVPLSTGDSPKGPLSLAIGCHLYYKAAFSCNWLPPLLQDLFQPPWAKLTVHQQTHTCIVPVHAQIHVAVHSARDG